MEWTKIKTRHFLFTSWTDRMTAGFVRLLCLTAHLERIPNDREMRSIIGPKSLESVSKVLRKSGKSLSQVLEKVLEDVDKVSRKRRRDRDYHKVYDKSRPRGLETNSAHREDKIREDKRRNNTIGEEIISLLNSLSGKKFSTEAEANLAPIRARLADGYKREDLEAVVRKKVTGWKGTDMEKFLRPETLFRPAKFESYLNEAEPEPDWIREAMERKKQCMT